MHAEQKGSGFMQELSYQNVFSRIGACYFALLAGSQVLSAIGMTAARIYAPWMMETPWFIWVFSYVPLYLVCVPLFFVLLKKWVPVVCKRRAPASFCGLDGENLYCHDGCGVRL